ncbi:MAG: NfeD family protein [Magnetococcales bacterium]|nr:NfeD family protein [Magnetococcales bacterium]
MTDLHHLEALLGQLHHWHWWIAAVLLLILEVTLPALFFLWLGVAAGITGCLVFLFPALGWKGQMLWFSGLSLLGIGLWHGVMRRRPSTSDLPHLNRRATQYVGRVFALTEPIINGSGRLRIDDALWKISGPDAPAQTRVTIAALAGTTLIVEPLPTTTTLTQPPPADATPPAEPGRR